MSEEEKNALERMSKIEHDQWKYHTRYMMSSLLEELHAFCRDGTGSFDKVVQLIKSGKDVELWNMLPKASKWLVLLSTPYEKLPEHAKESHREWARMSLLALKSRTRKVV